MSPLEFIALAVLITCSTAAVDFAAARYVLALGADRRFLAARWSVAQWAASSVGFILAIRVSIWLLPFECVGLALGTILGGKRATRPGVITG